MPSTDAPEPEQPRRRLRLSIGAAVTTGLVVLSAAVGWGILRGQASPTAVVSIDDKVQVGEPAGLYVHVLGAVEKPGLYVLESDARLVDALAAAGGTLDDADLAAVNLARPLADGEQVLVPVRGEGSAVPGATTPGVTAPGGGDGLLDLNSADEAALEELPRIGPALAQRIVAWRDENGRFRSVDDLLAVPGIGEKLLAGLRDLVRV